MRSPTPPSTKVGIDRPTSSEEFELILLVVYYAIYVFSNASTTYEPSNSPAKHLVMGALALVSLAASPASALRSLLLFLPVMAIYAVGGLGNYAVVAAVFALALPAVSRSLHIIVAQRRLGVVGLLLIISLVPAAIALSELSLDSLWSEQYGRGRLLMGYWHPKEAAASFALPLVLWMLTRRRAPGAGIMLLVPAMLWVVGSRNVALAVGLAFWLWRFPRTTKTLLMTLAIGTGVLLVIVANLYDVFDELSSARLSVWLDALLDPRGLADDDFVLGSRLAIDSYYVEVLASAGAAGLAVIALWIGGFYLALRRHRRRYVLAVPFFWAILLFAGFDSGIVSTGNIMHVVLWAFAASPLVRRKRRWRRPLQRPAAHPVAATGAG